MTVSRTLALELASAPVRVRGKAVVEEAPPSAYNQNTLLVGMPGAGKSFGCNSMIAAHLATEGVVWALRASSSAESESFDSQFGAQPVYIRPGNSVSLNPLSGFQTLAELQAAESLLIAWLRVLSAPFVVRTAESEAEVLAALEQALNRGWKQEGGSLGLSAVLYSLSTHGGPLGKELAHRIITRAQGLEVSIFEGPQSDLLRGAHVSFNVSTFGDTPTAATLSMTVLTLFAKSLLTAKVGHVRMLVIDELLRDENKESAHLVESLLWKARRHGAEVVVAETSAPPVHSATPFVQRVFLECCAHIALLKLDAPHALAWGPANENATSNAGRKAGTSVSATIARQRPGEFQWFRSDGTLRGRTFLPLWGAHMSENENRLPRFLRGLAWGLMGSLTVLGGVELVRRLLQ